MDRNTLFAYAREEYDSEPEHLWASHPDFAVLRRRDNAKWYALVMSVSGNKLGLESREEVEVVNLKCDPTLSGSLRMGEGVYPAYHMNKESWISVSLTGGVDDDTILRLLDLSYDLTAPKKKSVRSRRTGNSSK